jgi:hypothetical protein
MSLPDGLAASLGDELAAGLLLSPTTVGSST